MFVNTIGKLSVTRALDKGRYDGANETSGSDFQQQVDHATEQKVNRIEREASGTIRGLEARKSHSEDRLAAANARLDEILSQGRPKPLVYGLVLLVMFFAATSSEVYLLMPTMRGFGIADPLHQMLAAGGIVLMGAIVLKFLYTEARHYYGMAAEERRQAPNWKLQRVLLPLVGLVVLTGFLLLGMFRASEMIFANELDPSSDLGRFVGENDGLTKAVLVFLTVMLPVAGALALSHGIEIVRNWFEWTHLRYSSWRHNRRVHHTTKALEAAEEQLGKRIGEERSNGEEIKAEYRDGYNHGKRLGMHKLPVWFYVLKTVAVGLGMTFLMFLLDLWLARSYELPGWRWIFYIAGILFITGLYGVRQWLARERPKETDIRWKPRWRDEETEPTSSRAHGPTASRFARDEQLPLPETPSQKNGDEELRSTAEDRRERVARLQQNGNPRTPTKQAVNSLA